MYRRLLLTVLVVLSSVVPARGIPPLAAGALASDNVDYLARIPDVPAIAARFIGDTMYVSTYQGVRIYDVAGDVPLLLGAFELPHIENEDVDTNGEILLLGVDHFVSVANTLYVIDVSNPRVPLLLSVFRSPYRAHTASCINDCSYAWLAGDNGRVGVVDLRDPSAPVNAGSFQLPAVSGGARLSHDVQVDDAGVAWVSARGGVFGYHTANPVAPSYVGGRTRSNAADNFDNVFILHNSMRPNARAATPAKLADDVVDPGEVILVTEEYYDDSSCTNEGHFQTGWIHGTAPNLTVTKLDSYNVGHGTGITDAKPASVGLATSCSSHYFDARSDGIVADAWYEQGVRFLDVSDPTDIRPVGYFMAADAQTWAAYFHGGRVYVIDFDRGIEVLRFSGTAGAPTVDAPRLNPARAGVQPSPSFGYACRIPARTF